MNRYLLVSGILGVSLLVETITIVPAQAQEVTSEQRCEVALNVAESILVSGRTVWINNAGVYNLYESGYQSFPYQRPVSLSININGSDAEAVINSPQLLENIASTIMNGCQGIGSVSFVLGDTDWIVEFGMMGDQIRQFECVEPDSPYQNQWGYMVCI